MTRILVTGATGFIGRYLIPELLAAGYEVIASGAEPASSIDFPWIKLVRYVPCNINEPRTDWYTFFQSPEKLIHLAWPGLPNYQEPFHFEQNLPAAYSLIKNLVQSGLRDVTVTGTCFEYGKREGQLSEDLPTMPVTSYALAKDVLRRFLTELQRTNRFALKWVRLFYLHGEGQSPKSILEQLKTALRNREPEFRMSGGEQLRDYLPVEQVAQYLCQLATVTDFSGVVNCCSGKPISIRRLVEQFLKSSNSDIRLCLGYFPYPDHEPMAFWGSTDRLHSLLPAPRVHI